MVHKSDCNSICGVKACSLTFPDNLDDLTPPQSQKPCNWVRN